MSPPAAVVDLAFRLGVKPEDSSRRVTLTQTGRMRRSLASNAWMAFKAEQTISTVGCEFDWRAKAGPLGLIAGRDALIAGEGHFSITACGIVPLVRTASTAALVRGESMRYLAEIAWAPHAMLSNPALCWREVDAQTLAVSTGGAQAACEVLLTLDGDGRIAAAFAPDRPRAATPPTLPTPWFGRFSDYRLHCDVWLPFAGEVAWEIDGVEQVYWQGRIASWETQ